jgi:Zn-dependent metalloprotease
MKQVLLRRLHLPLMLLTLLAIAMPAGAATPSRYSVQRSALTMLRALTPSALNIHWSAATGTIDFLAASDPQVRLAYTPSAAERGNAVATAKGFLSQYRALFGLRDARQELTLTRVEADAQLNYRHVRLGQVYQGIPVFGKQMIVHLDAQQQIVAVNGRIEPNIDVPTEPAISAAQAEVAAVEGIQAELDEHERATIKSTVLRDKTQLVIYVDSAGKPRLTWSVMLLSETPLGEWRVFVNARRPRVEHLIDSLADAKRRVTFSADNSTDLPGRQLIDEGERSRDPIAQAAHDGAGVVYDYYLKTFQRDGIDGAGSPIVSTVHFGNDEADAENAAWVSEAQQMIYGDGGRIFKPLAYGLDVIGHELTHGVTDHTAQLVYEGQSGALNESYSDVFGALIDRANWTIGEQVVKSPPFPAPFMRSLEDPNMNGLYDPNDPLSGVGQPATVSQYAELPLSRRYDNGGVHINSGIPNHAAYLVAQAIGREKLEQIYYRTLTLYLSPQSDFFDAARATVRAVQDLYGDAEVAGVRQAFAQVGIDVGGSDTVPQQQEPSQPSGNAPPPAPQPLPAGCTDAVINGTFEHDGGWVEVSQSDVAIIDPELPHTGKRSAWLGGTDQESLQNIYQDVRIPANATSVQLSYYRLVHREVTGLLSLFSADARFNVELTDGNGDVLATLEELSSAQGDDTWRQAKIDLRKFAGKNVQLTFSAENPRGNVSSFFVDDVSLAVCTSGAGPAAPPAPAPSQGGVVVEGTITNVDTGRGIDGAQVFILKPGLSASNAAADDTLTRNEVLTSGVTDGNGFYQTDDPVPINQSYSVIVFASGYRPVLADDGMEVPANATSPFVVDATLRRGR